MKKGMHVFLCSLFCIFLCHAALAEEDSASGLRIVRCEEQGFSTLCDAAYTYDFHPDAGITIYAGDTEAKPYVSIFKSDGSGFNAEMYFNNAFTNLMETSYGSSLVDVGTFKEYDIAGITMPGQLCLYQEGEDLMGRFCLYDILPDAFIRYEAFFTQSDVNTAVSIIATAATYYQPDPDYYSGEGGSGGTGQSENPPMQTENKETSSALLLADLLGYDPASLDNASVTVSVYPAEGGYRKEELSGEKLEKAIRMAQTATVTAKLPPIDGTGTRSTYVYYKGEVKLLTLSFYEGRITGKDASYEISY